MTSKQATNSSKHYKHANQTSTETTMGQKISTTSDLMNAIGIDKDTASKVNENIKNHSISQNLTILRAKTGLSQTEMAKKMKTSQSFISKLESASNNQIKIEDMCTYLATLGYETTISISRPQNIAQKIKSTYNQLSALLAELQKYAVDDDSILKGIAKFELEATHNMLNLASTLLERSSSKMKKIYPQPEPQIILDDSIAESIEKELALA